MFGLVSSIALAGVLDITVERDPDGDGDPTGGIGLSGVTVRVYRNDGGGSPTGPLVATLTTGSTGSDEASCGNPNAPGPEVALTRYRQTGGAGSGMAVANWSSGHVRYRKNNGGWVNPPAKLRSIYRGCGTAWTRIEWRVSQSSLCPPVGTPGTNTYSVGTRGPTQGANTPFAFNPATWNFNGVPNDRYDLCATIVDGATGDTSDDTIISNPDFVWVTD